MTKITGADIIAEYLVKEKVHFSKIEDLYGMYNLFCCIHSMYHLAISGDLELLNFFSALSSCQSISQKYTSSINNLTA